MHLDLRRSGRSSFTKKSQATNTSNPTVERRQIPRLRDDPISKEFSKSNSDMQRFETARLSTLLRALDVLPSWAPVTARRSRR
jgi:hypothetical protein